MLKKPDSTLRFALVSRNFANYPLARDSHVRPHWWKSQKTGRWLADLPGNSRIRLILPREVEEHIRRCPTGLDMALLFVLLRAAQLQDSPDIAFTSRAALLAEMELNDRDARHYENLKAALALWSKLVIRFDCWFDANSTEHLESEKRTTFLAGKGTISRSLPPPIRVIDRKTGLRIRVDPTWREIFSKRYFIRIPLPLPIRAPCQNLILWLMTAVAKEEDGFRFTQSKTLRQLCRIIGVNHGSRNVVLRQAVEAAARWFREHGGSIDPVEEDDGITFIISNPKIPRPKAEQPPFKRVRLPPTRAKSTSSSKQEPDNPVKRPAGAPKPKRIVAVGEEGQRDHLWELPDGRYVDDEELAGISHDTP